MKVDCPIIKMFQDIDNNYGDEENYDDDDDNYYYDDDDNYYDDACWSKCKLPTKFGHTCIC